MDFISALQSLIAGIIVFVSSFFGNTASYVATQPAAVAVSLGTSTIALSEPGHATTSTATSTPKVAPRETVVVSAKKSPPKPTTSATTPIASPSSDTAVRIMSPYTTPSVSFETINTQTRSALVNIFCIPNGNSLAEISGSGIIIDPRGVILTNAHVGQYSLLEESNVTIDCLIRTGSPARAAWHAKLLYIPPAWVNKHASEITQSHALGTGEDDFALLQIDRALNGQAMPSAFPFVQPDSREAVAFEGDTVLVASYPAGFVGAITAQNGLSQVTTIAKIQKLMTFDTGTVDVIDVGGVVVAQAGSSGGAVVNQWNRLVGLLVTSSAGETTMDRSLRADTIAHIDRSLYLNSGMHLQEFLSGDLSVRRETFVQSVFPALKKTILTAAGL